jgi:DNA repair exonuclease SbcCD ATPase subunit
MVSSKLSVHMPALYRGVVQQCVGVCVQAKLSNMLASTKSSADKLQKESAQLSDRVAKLQADLEEQIHSNTQLLAENGQKQLAIKAKDEEIVAARAEAARIAKLRDQALKKIKQVEDARAETEQQRDSLQMGAPSPPSPLRLTRSLMPCQPGAHRQRGTGSAERSLPVCCLGVSACSWPAEVGSLEKQVDAANRVLDAEKKRYEELLRERDILTKLKSQAESSSVKQMDLIKVNEGMKRNLEQEVQGFKLEAQRQQRMVWQLEKEREKYGQEASLSTSKYLQAVEEVKLREMAIVDLQKKIGEAETRFKQQQNLYEAVRVDRNMYSKRLIESQDEIQEMKRKFKIMNHQIEQLKDEISAKDMALVKEHFDHLRVHALLCSCPAAPVCGVRPVRCGLRSVVVH